MATFDQRHQHVHGPQINADLVDLSNAIFAPDNARADGAEVRDRLVSVGRAVRAAIDHGELPAAEGAAVAAAVDRARADLEGGDQAAASGRVREAVQILQTAAPAATIAGALLALWNTLGGAV